ncbi:MAG: hypothetical protein PGN16_00620 [Sphingomonas phyllosphaerae]|uniref:hypothetical protein n=1 Tax=Sphingomonas phyllosphaerae TaxID=257003 RepID=UPI002FF8A1E3
MPNVMARARAFRDRDFAALLVGATLLYVACVPFMNGDIRNYLIPWMQYLLDHGRFAALGDDFSEYAPPYLYLLALGSWTAPVIGVVPAIKLVSVGGTILLAVTMYALLATRLTRRQALSGGALTLIAPTVVANGPVWGQCDALYTCCAILAVAAFIRQRPALAMAAVGAALSFKLQGVFIAPLVLAMLLAGRARWWMLAIIPTVYAAAMLPAWLAGRPAIDLALLYLGQGQHYHDLARSVPNIWQILRALVTIPYPIGVAIGLIAAASATIVVAWRTRHHLMQPEDVVLVALLGAIVVPYLLPKMHNRYFFMADLLAGAYVFMRPTPRAFWIVRLVTIGSLLSYATFLLHLTGGAFVGAFAMTAGLVLTWREVRERLPYGRPLAPLAEAAHFKGSCPQFIKE